MLVKILSSKTSFEVLEIIDRKIALIESKTNDTMVLNRFIEDSLFNLRHVNEATIEADQFSKIRAGVGHLQNLRMHYKV